MKISDIIKQTPEFFPETEHIEIARIIGEPMILRDFRLYTNDKGDGVAMKLISREGIPYKVFTHAKAIVRLLKSDEIAQVNLAQDDLEVSVTVKKNKSGTNYYMLE